MQEWWLQLQVYVDGYLSQMSVGKDLTHERKSINHDLMNNSPLTTEMYFRLQETDDISASSCSTSYKNLIANYNKLGPQCPEFIRRDIALDLKNLAVLLQQENLKHQVAPLIKNIEQDLTDAAMIVYYMRFLDRTAFPVLRKLASWRWYLASFNRDQYAELLNTVRELQGLAMESIKSLQRASTKRRAYKMDPMFNQTYKKIYANLAALRDCQLMLKAPPDLAPDYEQNANAVINFPELAQMFALAKASYFFLYSNYNQQSETRFEQELIKVLDVMQGAISRMQAEINNLEAEVNAELSLEQYHFTYSTLYQRAKELDGNIDSAIPLVFRALDVAIRTVSTPITHATAEPEPILHMYNQDLPRATPVEPLSAEPGSKAQDEPLTRLKKT